MNVKYSKIRYIASKESIESLIEIVIEEKSDSASIKGSLNLTIKYDDNFDIASKQIMKFANFDGPYFILNVEKHKLITHFGLTKIKGRMLYLITKEALDKETKNTSLNDYLLYNRLLEEDSYSHLGFISDNWKRFVISENYRYHKNKQITILKPTEIILRKLRNQNP